MASAAADAERLPKTPTHGLVSKAAPLVWQETSVWKRSQNRKVLAANSSDRFHAHHERHQRAA
jgi:hypothetical protein